MMKKDDDDDDKDDHEDGDDDFDDDDHAHNCAQLLICVNVRMHSMLSLIAYSPDVSTSNRQRVEHPEGNFLDLGTNVPHTQMFDSRALDRVGLGGPMPTPHLLAMLSRPLHPSEEMDQCRAT